jgi:hypothetical protein
VKLVRGDLAFHCTVRVRAVGWLVVPAVAVTVRVYVPAGGPLGLPLLPPQEQRSMRSDDENHGSYRRSTALLTHPQVEPPMPSAQTPTTMASAQDRRGAALPWCAPRSSHSRQTPWSSSPQDLGCRYGASCTRGRGPARRSSRSTDSAASDRPRIFGSCSRCNRRRTGNSGRDSKAQARRRTRTVRGPFGALSVITRFPVRVPDAVGAKLTCTVHSRQPGTKTRATP